MKNIVVFKISSTEPVIIKHNGIDVLGKEVDCVKGTNKFTIEGNNFTVDDVLMYDMGTIVIKNYGYVVNNVWTLEYEYPVFSWLHKILEHGWLLKEDNEQDTHSKTCS